MERAGDQFLASAAFAEDEHPRVGRRDGLDHLAQFAHARGIADDLFQLVSLVGAGAQGGVLVQQPVALGAAETACSNSSGAKGLAR